jgi:hypothetical protein
MSRHSRKNGFSLAETLIALGVLTVGMLFIAGVFPVGIHFTYLSIDRTISACVADEAFAKVRLYMERALNDPCESASLEVFETEHLRDFNDWFAEETDDYELYWEDFAYPSIPSVNEVDKQYCWSALCRIVGEGDPNDTERMIQVTVFVNKRMGPGEKYYIANYDEDDFGEDDYGIIENWNDLFHWPMPVKVEVRDSDSDSTLEDNELRMVDVSGQFYEKNLINDGYRIVDDKTGRIYRVLERYPTPDDDIILLDKDRQGEIDYVWVIPPAKLGGKSSCVAVYQKILRF